MSESYPYQRIAQELRDEIESGRRTPGSPLPSEQELSNRYGAARMTVRRALDELRAHGLIVTGQGRRTVVRFAPKIRLLQTGANYRRRAGALPGRTDWSAEVLAQGGQPIEHLLGVGRVPAPSEIAELLEVDDGALVIVRRHLLEVDGVPSQLSDGYYLAALAAGNALQLPDPLAGAASDYIENELGRLITRFVEDLSARTPTAAEARTLHMRPRGPIVRTLRTAYDRDDKPLEVLDSRQPADRHTWRYEIRVPPPGSE